MGPLAFQIVSASFGSYRVKFNLQEQSMNRAEQAFESDVLHVG